MQLIIALGNEALELACRLRRPKYGRYIDNSNEFIWVEEIYVEEDPMIEDARREAMSECYGEILSPDVVYGKYGTRK